MNPIEYIGFIAGILVAFSVLPQILKSWRTKSTKDVSIYRSIINLTGQVLRIIYGFMIASWALAVMSGITFLMNLSMIVLKLKFG
jgi:MtN3 and saliva related transmembrane protein